VEFKGLVESGGKGSDEPLAASQGYSGVSKLFQEGTDLPKTGRCYTELTLTHPSAGPFSGAGLLCNLMIRYGGVHVPIHSNLARRPEFFTCSICNESVELETTKIDESGKPVHEECYLQKVSLKWSIRPPPTAVDAHFNHTPLSQAIVAFLNSANTRPLTNLCPDCGSQLEHGEYSFFYRGQTWEILLPICLNCHPISDFPPHAA
jgi:hypothetical protein